MKESVRFCLPSHLVCSPSLSGRSCTGDQLYHVIPCFTHDQPDTCSDWSVTQGTTRGAVRIGSLHTWLEAVFWSLYAWLEIEWITLQSVCVSTMLCICVCVWERERERAMLCVCLSVCRQYLFPISVDITHTHTHTPCTYTHFPFDLSSCWIWEREGGREGGRESESVWGDVMGWGECVSVCMGNSSLLGCHQMLWTKHKSLPPSPHTTQSEPALSECVCVYTEMWAVRQSLFFWKVKKFSKDQISLCYAYVYTT